MIKFSIHVNKLQFITQTYNINTRLRKIKMKEDVGISKLKRYVNSIRMVLTQEVNNIAPKIKISTFTFTEIFFITLVSIVFFLNGG